VAATIAVAVYVMVALRRIAYPFDLEWMEGSMVHHVSRVLSGQPLYAAPALDFTPFLYPPFYYYVSAAAARVTGLGFMPLRLVSFVSSLAIFWLIYRLAQRDTGSRYAGMVASGLCAATYRIGGAWFDLARNDSLFLALMLAAIYLIRFRESPAGWAWAGLLLALSAFTKQTALIIAPALLLYGALIDWKRAIVLMLAFGTALGAATWALNIRTHGWYVYYVLRLPQRIQQAAADRVPFWTDDILAALPIASALAVATLIAGLPFRGRRGAFWPMIAAGGIGAAWLSRLHVGAYDNVLIPAYVCLSLLAAIAGRRVPARVPARHRPLIRIAIAALCAIQIVSLRYSLEEQTPSARDAELALQLGRRLAESDGEVFVPFHSFVPTPSGPVMHAHSWAVFDVLRAGDAAAAAKLSGEIKYAFDEAEYRMVVIDKIEPWMEPDLDRWYRPAEPALDSDSLWTRTGYHTRPRWIYVPRAPASQPPDRRPPR
jgi:hypothetical protein